MALGKRQFRRVCGLFAARLPELNLAHVKDPRSSRGKRWRHLDVLLRAVIVAMACGKKSCKETEDLTDDLSPAMRRQLHIPRRIPDTTLRTTLCAVEPNEMRAAIAAQIRAAHRRHALGSDELPLGSVAIDGKYTAIQCWGDQYAKKKTHSQGQGAYGLVGTMTATLISSQARVCLDACPIPTHTNEMGHFSSALSDLMSSYGSLNLFSLISTDAGMCSLENANLVVNTHHLHYLFRLKADQPTLFAETKRLLQHLLPKQALAKTEDVVGTTLVTRSLFITDELSHFLNWKHLETGIRIHVEKRDRETEKLVESEDHYAISSLPINALSAPQWLLLFRRHWAVENNCHNTWDKIFSEDKRPWLISGTLPDKAKGSVPQGTVVVMLLRRLAYNLLSLYRSVTLRGEEQRRTPWKTLLGLIYATLICVTEDIVENLRSRSVSAVAIA